MMYMGRDSFRLKQQGSFHDWNEGKEWTRTEFAACKALSQNTRMIEIGTETEKEEKDTFGVLEMLSLT